MSDLTSSDVDAMTVLFALSIFCGQEMIPRRIALVVDTHPLPCIETAGPCRGEAGRRGSCGNFGDIISSFCDGTSIQRHLPLSFIVAFKHNSQVDLDLSPFCVTSLISDHIPGFQEKHTLKHFYDKRLEGDMVVCW